LTDFAFTVLFKGFLTITFVEISSFIIGYFKTLEIFELTFFAFKDLSFLFLFFKFILCVFLEPLFFTLIE
jgi:hypothetical protein